MQSKRAPALRTESSPASLAADAIAVLRLYKLSTATERSHTWKDSQHMSATTPPSSPSDGHTFEELIATLSDPTTYPNQPDGVERIETHASVVFLAGEEVYKLKKPVDFGFLDYSTLDRRKRMCELEIEMNRRLAPDAYIDVVEVVRGDRGIQIGGNGETVDYLVHMRHLPESATLASLVKREAVRDIDIDAIARHIGAFHQRADHGPEVARWGRLEVVRQNIGENFEQTETYIGRTLPARIFGEISGYARAFLRDNEDLFCRRKEDGMIRDGHGDLRAEHVYLLNEVTIVDCIEFNDRLRCGDVAVDLGFLAMDLDAMNRPDLSDRLVASYVDASGFEVASVLDFYRCYRAYVRGKVASFRLNGDDGEARREARRFFHLSHRYATGDRGPRLIVMSGLTGSGKSTLAAELAETLPAAVLDSDTTRKRLAGIDPSERQEIPYGTGIYSAAMSERVYQALLDGARERLQRGQTVILDATYTKRADRQAATSLANELGADFYIPHCEASEDLTRQRLARRGTEPARVSDGRWEIYLAQRDAAEPFSGEEEKHRLLIDSSQPIETQAEAVLTALES